MKAGARFADQTKMRIEELSVTIKLTEIGANAARHGLAADECPYPIGRQRREWMAGYFSAKPPMEDDPDEVKDEE